MNQIIYILRIVWSVSAFAIILLSPECYHLVKYLLRRSDTMPIQRIIISLILHFHEPPPHFHKCKSEKVLPPPFAHIKPVRILHG